MEVFDRGNDASMQFFCSSIDRFTVGFRVFGHSLPTSTRTGYLYISKDVDLNVMPLERDWNGFPASINLFFMLIS